MENRCRKDTNAVVLKFCAVLHYLHTPANCPVARDKHDGMTNSDLEHSYLESVLEGLEIYSCQLHEESATALSIVDPCHVQIEMTSKRNTENEYDTRIALDLSSPKDIPVYARFSYRDFRLFVSILNSLSMEKSPGASDNSPSDKQEGAGGGRDGREMSNMRGGCHDSEAPDAIIELPNQPQEYDAYHIKLVTLLDMGFDMRDVVRALSYFHGSLQRSAIWLCRNRSVDSASSVRRQQPDSGLHGTGATPDASRSTDGQHPKKPSASPLLASSLSPWRYPSRDLGMPFGGSLHALFAEAETMNEFSRNVKLLAECGYAENDCVLALQAGNGNTEAAAAWLLINAPPALRGDHLSLHDAVRDVVTNANGATAGAVHSSVQSIIVRSKHVRLCVIDDCDGRDLPLLETKVDGLTLSTRRECRESDTTTGLRLGGSFSCDFYNSNLSTWEPCVEPWSISMEGRMVW